MKKKQIRAEIRESLAKITYEDYKERSLAIGKRLLQEPSIIEGKTIAITMSNRPEVDTTAIIEEFWRRGKRVVVPKCEPLTKKMEFYEIDGFFQLERVYKDILEPIVDLTESVTKDEIDVIIVPGIVFDPCGYRIGFGGGYYDRFLQGFDGTRIAMAFNEQLVPDVPKECHDLPVHTIITELMRVDCTRNRKEHSS